MIVKNVSKEKNTVSFDVELDSAEFEKYINGAFLKKRSRIQVPGFRKGKASRKVIEGMYGASIFHDDAMDEAANDAFAFGVGEEKLENVGRPSLTGGKVNEDTSALLSFKTDVYPEVKLGKYKGLKAEKASCEVKEEDIDAELGRLRKQNARLVTLERAAENGDTVNINYQGTLNGKPFDGGTAENQNLVLGSNSFIPGFEEKLTGMKTGEDRDLELTFPAEYFEKKLAGKDVVFHVHCNAVRLEELPELDDEFAKDNDFDTLKELKDDIRAKRLASLEENAKNEFTDALVDQAVENMELDLPESMVEEKIDNMMLEYSRYMQAQGMTLESYINRMGGDVSNFRESCRGTARKQILTEILLTEVAKAEKMEVSDEDCKAECAKMARAYGMKSEDLEKKVNFDDLRADLKRRKAMEVIAESGIAEKPAAKKDPAKKAEKSSDKAEEKPAAKRSTSKKKAVKKEADSKDVAEEAASEKKTTAKKKAAEKEE